MKVIFKRVVAYMIDILLVAVLSNLITTNSYINKDYNKYVKVYEEYDNFYSEYEDSKEELEELLEDKELSEKEYEKNIDELNNLYNDKNIDYNYKLIKYSVISSIINILLTLLYFVVIQHYFNGQTLGKRIMKLRVVSCNGKGLNMVNYLIRCLILNNVFINVLSVIFILVLSKNSYLIYNEIVYVINYIIELAILFMIVYTKQNRGLHDYLGNSKVVWEGEVREVQ